MASDEEMRVPRRETIDAAINQVVEEGYLVDYLRGRESEVAEMLMAEFEQERILKLCDERGINPMDYYNGTVEL